MKNIPVEFRKKYPKIEWKEIIGTRDKMIHHYFGVDLEFTFDIIQKDIPKLKNQVEDILNKS